FETLLLFRFLQGVGLAPLGVLSVTIIGDLYEGEHRITAMGYTGTVLGIGTAVLPVVGGVLAMFGWRYPFMLPVLALPLAVLVHLFLQNPEPRADSRLSDYFQEALRAMWRKNAIGLFLLTMLTLVILYGPFVTYVPLLLQDRFLATPAIIGVAIATASIFAGVASSQLGRLAGKIREAWILRISFVMFLFSMVLIPAVPSLLSFALPLALFGVAMGLGSPSRLTMISGLTSTDQRAAVLAVNSLLQRVGQTVGPALAGAILAGFGFNAVFLAGAGVALCMIAISIWLVE
ncbi:MAG: MFS transporter, partial [Deltaproteobacteria bacterium]|nr:MFS transporter [Deltaproteobacteria bacterium]